LGSKLVGFGRVVGDGVLYFYIADVFVDPAQRGQGLGDLIISTIIDRIREMAEPTATVAVLAAPGRESFYEKFGFERCPNKYFGDGMAFLEPIENFPVWGCCKTQRSQHSLHHRPKQPSRPRL